MSNPIYPSDYANGSQNIFTQIGHPGKWNQVLAITGNTEVNFTGSNNYGVSGIIVDTAGQTIYLSNGGSLPGTALQTKVIYELSVSKIVSTGGTIYALYRNNKVI